MNLAPLHQLDEHRGLAVLRDQVRRTSITQVARDLGYSHTAISLLLAGKYGSGARIARAALAFYYERRHCPHLEREITGGECMTFAARPFSTHNPDDNRHWRACQRCPHKQEAR